MRFTPEQLVSKLTTPTGRSTGSMPIEMHVKTMNMPGKKKMKMRRTGFLFIVIQFLMRRARMFENFGTAQVQFETSWSSSSLGESHVCNWSYIAGFAG